MHGMGNTGDAGAQPFYVYIAGCSDDTYYTGYCRDVRKRLRQHNAGKGAKYVRGRLPVRLLYMEAVATRDEALRREAAIKKLSRAQKEELVGSQA